VSPSRFDWLALPLALCACTLAFQRDLRQCRVDADCQALDPGFLCGEDAVCVSFVAMDRVSSSPEGNECRSDAECLTRSVPALCRDGYCRAIAGASGRCVPVGAPNVTDEMDALALGLLVPRQELDDDGSKPGIRRVVGAAIDEFNASRSAEKLASLPPLLGIACDESNPDELEYLLHTLNVRLIIGPSDVDRVELALLRISDQALLIPPFADAPNLEPTASDRPGYVLSCRPNRKTVQPYFIDAVAEVGRRLATLGPPAPAAISAGLVVSSDPATASFADGLDAARLDDAGVRVFRYTDYPLGVSLVEALALAEPPVNLVVAASAEGDWAQNMAAVDAASRERGDDLPFYLLPENRGPTYTALLQEETPNVDPLSRSLRMIVLGRARSSRGEIALDEFVERVDARASMLALAGLEYIYDCTYAAIYATIAAAARLRRSPLGLAPEAVVLGLRSLAGGPSMLVGPSDIARSLRELASQRGLDGAIDLVGISGELDFLTPPSEDPSSAREYISAGAPDGALYCLDVHDRTLCDMGVAFPAAGGPPVQVDTACACFPSSVMP
jgi:hypothetical protein